MLGRYVPIPTLATKNSLDPDLFRAAPRPALGGLTHGRVGFHPMASSLAAPYNVFNERDYDQPIAVTIYHTSTWDVDGRTDNPSKRKDAMKKKTIRLLALLVVAGGLAIMSVGCHMMEGAGKDIQDAGKSIEGAAN